MQVSGKRIVKELGLIFKTAYSLINSILNDKISGFLLNLRNFTEPLFTGSIKE